MELTLARVSKIGSEVTGTIASITESRGESAIALHFGRKGLCVAIAD